MSFNKILIDKCDYELYSLFILYIFVNQFTLKWDFIDYFEIVCIFVGF